MTSLVDRSRRKNPRVAGPFEGVRLGFLDMKVNIHDLSVGGCLVESPHHERVGSVIGLQIDLPGGNPLTVEGEILYLRADYGFAVKFVNLNEQQIDRLHQVIRMRGNDRFSG